MSLSSYFIESSITAFSLNVSVPQSSVLELAVRLYTCVLDDFNSFLNSKYCLTAEDACIYFPHSGVIDSDSTMNLTAVLTLIMYLAITIYKTEPLVFPTACSPHNLSQYQLHPFGCGTGVRHETSPSPTTYVHSASKSYWSTPSTISRSLSSTPIATTLVHYSLLSELYSYYCLSRSCTPVPFKSIDQQIDPFKTESQ